MNYQSKRNSDKQILRFVNKNRSYNTGKMRTKLKVIWQLTSIVHKPLLKGQITEEEGHILHTMYVTVL